LNIFKYIDAKAGKDVWLYEIIGGGHTWGNKDMNTAEEIWKFFTLFIKYSKEGIFKI
jgi:polyhydroxybutyrate depolymerase